MKKIAAGLNHAVMITEEGAAYAWGAKSPGARKMSALAKACMAYPSVAKFLSDSEYATLKADPFGILSAEYEEY